ncbi:MAG: hypothetical protein V4492_07300, partial [Chlamydiota bacterium]
LVVLVQMLKECAQRRERIELLNQDAEVQRWLQKQSSCGHLLEEEEVIFKSLVAIGQHALVEGMERSICPELLPVETFYSAIGGIVGYHQKMLSLLSESQVEANSAPSKQASYHRPQGIDLSEPTDHVNSFILQGILALPLLGEIYPVGGAADRLRFCDAETGQPLPAAKLPFCGRTLLEGLIRDVEAREYLYYHLFGEQVQTPIAMMTSSEKDNHRQILSICEEKGWFGRSKELFRFFCQPLVPTMDRFGQWCLGESGRILMKPGGHGVMWKVAKDEGVFDWLEELGRKKVLVRQINNPISGVDYGLLAFCGVGFAEDKAFGFASCPRQVQSAEGVNVLIERPKEGSFEYCLTSIEYCDFLKFGIEDCPVEQGSAFSQYPSNTNILFADIAAVSGKVESSPIPGMLVNLKKMTFVGADGASVEKEVVRLESTMQNIADSFIQQFDQPLPACENEALSKLSTYITYQHRHKTISTAKKEYQSSGSLLETPEGCYWDLLKNARELLTLHCAFTLPELQSMEEYIARGPNFLFQYHPALGPVYDVIRQKLRKGTLHKGSELLLEIAEVNVEALDLNGSLRITAQDPLKEKCSDGSSLYSDRIGRCQLINVTVENAGIDRSVANVYWKNEIQRNESCEIIIHGNGEFYAENVTFRGAMRIEVQAGTRVTAIEKEGDVHFSVETLNFLSWYWLYHLTEEGEIVLEKINTTLICSLQ